MIPKIIHYCWFGGAEKPESVRKCIKSWRKKCPDYKVLEWNEDTFDLSECPLYVQQAYAAGKWAFVTDYVRLAVVYQHGGIYLDTDVELVKRLDKLLQYQAYFGFENANHINTGVGFGAVAGCEILAEMMVDYQGIPFLREDGTLDTTPCPQRNTEVLVRHGLITNDAKQLLEGNILILPSIYLCPINYHTNKRRYSLQTISIHHYSASWHSEVQKQHRVQQLMQEQQRRQQRRKARLLYIPKKIVKILLGQHGYEQLKKRLRK